ncbi:hypothetical protein DFH06DRAFT_1353505 [Mycena polygramma]|nr:hypothetical protein DFH06DRAFT_1353505 [Mycena polygramma]
MARFRIVFAPVLPPPPSLVPSPRANSPRVRVITDSPDNPNHAIMMVLLATRLGRQTATLLASRSGVELAILAGSILKDLFCASAIAPLSPMPPTVDSPPPYSEVDTLIVGLGNVNLTAEPHRPPSSPQTPPRRRGAADSPQPSAREYQFESPGRSGRTTQWQGVPNGRAQAVRSPARPRPKRGAHAVFFGRHPGVYPEWFGPTGAEKEVKKAKGAVHQGYSSVGEANTAYEYADQHGWTGVRTSRPPSPSSPPPPLPDLPVPQRFDAQTHNPLHGATASNPLWHVVYAGITPGIYASYLECALNTVGLSGASYDSAATREEALLSWAIAESAGRIRRQRKITLLAVTHPDSTTMRIRAARSASSLAFCVASDTAVAVFVFTIIRLMGGLRTSMLALWPDSEPSDDDS